MTLDYFAKVDVSSLAAFTKTDFGGDVFDGQSLVNASGVIVELSFDGTNTHGEMAAAGATSALSWEGHNRGSVWLRRQAGSGGGPLYVHVYAMRAP